MFVFALVAAGPSTDCVYHGVHPRDFLELALQDIGLRAHRFRPLNDVLDKLRTTLLNNAVYAASLRRRESDDGRAERRVLGYATEDSKRVDIFDGFPGDDERGERGRKAGDCRARPAKPFGGKQRVCLAGLGRRFGDSWVRLVRSEYMQRMVEAYPRKSALVS